MDTKTCLEVLYQWILEDVEKEPKTLSSKMILFRGEEVFRVALKNTVEKQTLIFVAIKLNKIGMKVREVNYSNENLKNSKEPLEKRNQENETFQVFSNPLNKRVSGKTTFNFYIQIEGSEKEFSYQLADRLLKNQLWMAVNKLELTDIDFIVKGKKISAHKCILAARSSVFNRELSKDENVKQIEIDDVDYSTFEQFLYFLYTGETNKPLAHEQLLKLANRYQLTTLIRLCNNALRPIYAEEWTRPLSSLITTSDAMSSEIRPMKDTELFFDPSTSTLMVDWNFNTSAEANQTFFKYQNENFFSAHVTGVLRGSFLVSPTLHLTCAKLRNTGCHLVEVFFSCKQLRNWDGILCWTKMERRNVEEKGLILICSAQIASSLLANEPYTISFRIKISSTIDNYHYEMMDDKCATELWNAAGGYRTTMTDVEIFVGSRQFEAHRVVLAARSPVFKAQLEKDNTIAKSSISLGETVDPNIFEKFLKFLYMGTLNFSVEDKQLLALAEKYEVETLKKLCQNANQELGVDELTSCFFAAF